MAINLNQKLNDLLETFDLNNKPNLFLHVCCGPCSTAVLYKLFKYFNIYIIFSNSNIDTRDEFDLRLKQLEKVILYNNYNINIIYNNYNHDDFLSYVKGYESCKEGGDRCKKCFELRLSESYNIAKEYISSHNMKNDTNYLCTTLSISPHKNAELIEEIGESICSDDEIIKYLPSDFKKEDGYLNSIKLSKEYELYRQNYCGCEFSKSINS